MKRLVYGMTFILLMICGCSTTNATVVAVPPAAAVAMQDVVINQDTLKNLDNSTRNQIFYALQQQDKFAAKAREAEEAIKNQVPVVSEEALTTIADMDIRTFKEKGEVVVDTITSLLEKVGITANKFIDTSAGTALVLGVMYKMGIFGGVWKAVVGGIGAFLFTLMLIGFLTKKKMVLKKRGSDGKVTSSEEVVVPRVSFVAGNDVQNRTLSASWGAIACLIAIAICISIMV